MNPLPWNIIGSVPVWPDLYFIGFVGMGVGFLLGWVSRT